MRPSQGFWGTGEQGHLFQRSKYGGNRGTKTTLGNIGNQDFDFGEQGNKVMYFRKTREQV